MFAPSELERHLASARFALPDRRNGIDSGLFSRLLGRGAQTAPGVGDAGSAIVLRHATEGDGAALARLAELDGHALPLGSRIVVESGGRLVAAADVATGAAIADPFFPSQTAVSLARVRAAQLRAA